MPPGEVEGTFLHLTTSKKAPTTAPTNARGNKYILIPENEIEM